MLLLLLYCSCCRCYLCRRRGYHLVIRYKHIILLMGFIDLVIVTIHIAVTFFFFFFLLIFLSFHKAACYDVSATLISVLASNVSHDSSAAFLDLYTKLGKRNPDAEQSSSQVACPLRHVASMTASLYAVRSWAMRPARVIVVFILSVMCWLHLLLGRPLFFFLALVLPISLSRALHVSSHGQNT